MSSLQKRREIFACLVCHVACGGLATIYFLCNEERRIEVVQINDDL